jgi:phosphoglycerol transferase MdoB-like AlkP superfamily enzyme
MKKFFEMAEKQPWFSNTVFVIVADHCASSAGKTELPVDKYRIPAMIYSRIYSAAIYKAHVANRYYANSFGLLNFNYQSKFYGQDVMQADYKPRALIGTYQDLGMIKMMF